MQNSFAHSSCFIPQCSKLSAIKLTGIAISVFFSALQGFVVVVVLLFYVHGKHLRSRLDGQLT